MKKRITITTCLWTLILLVAGLASCDDEIDCGRTSEISSNSVVQKVLVWNGEAYQNPDNENRIRLGSQVRLEGNNLEQVTAVYFNGKEVSAETFAASAKTYIETAIPDDTPIGYEAGEWRDTLIVRSPINEFGMPLTIISKGFNIIAVAKFNNDGITVGNAVTQAQLRDKIQLQGTGLNYVTEVYVNGLQLSDFEKSEATINLTIPEKTPIGERAGTDANIIRLVNEFGEELEYGFTIIGQQPVLTHVADADGTVITSALCGETVQAVGKYLESVSGITCNGVSVTTYEVDAEGTNITFTIPENLPTGESYAENNLVLVVDEEGLDDVAVTFTFIGAAPVIDCVSHTLAKAGERIRIYGSNFTGVNKVVFPGDVEAAVVVDNETDLDAKGELWIHSADGYEMIDVIIPDNGDKTSGALYVETEAGSGGYSYAYMNCSSNIFINSYANDTEYFSANTRLAVNQSASVGVQEGHWPMSPTVYAAYPQDGTANTSTLNSNNSGVFRFMPQVALADLIKQEIGNADCKDLAFQFDCWMTNKNDYQWTSGVVRFGFNLPSGSNGDCHILPWHKSYESRYKEVEQDFSMGWKTITVPLEELATTPSGTTFSSAINALNAENPAGVIIVFGNIMLTPDGSGERDSGTEMNDFRMYFGNFRIVPYTKPKTE